MRGNIKVIDGIYPVTRSEAVYVNSNTTLEEILTAANVKAFGAVGDGVTNDSEAIQKALDSVKNGGTVYFPKGVYCLHSHVKYYSNQDLIFENGATLLRGLATMNILLTNYCDTTTGGYDMTENVNIIGGTFDANINFTNNNCTSLGFIHSKNTKVINCTFKHQATAWHNIEINASKNTVIDGCLFTNVTTSGTNGEMIQIDGALNTTVYPWEGLKDGTPSICTTIKNCYFDESLYSPAIGNHSDSAHSYTMIHDNIFNGLKSSRGTLAFVNSMKHIDVYNNTFINCTTGINTNAQQVTVRNNNFSNVGTISTGSAILSNNTQLGSGNSTASIFSGLKATFYGDSLTEKNGHYTKGYHSWISDILGFVSYENYGVSGYTIKNVADKIASTNATGDIIFVMAGVNDQTFHKPLGTFTDDPSTDTTYGALKLLCSTLKEKYPTKLIVYITPHYQIKYPSNLGITSYEVSKAIKEVCYQYSIPVYDNFQLSGIYPQNTTNKNLYTTDGCHWNNLGHEKVGKNIAKYMLNTFGYVYTTGASNISITLSASTLTVNEGSSSSFTVRLAQQPSANKTVSLSVNNSDVRLDKAQLTFTTSNWNVAQTVNVTVAEDDSDYNNESCIISLSGSGLNSAVVNVTITDNDERPSTPTPTPTPTSYIGKTATITSAKFGGYYHLTALINKPDFDTTNKPFSLEMKVSNISNIKDCQLTKIGIFADTSGEVTNSNFVGQLAQATTADVIDGNTATITTTGTIPGNPTESYLKIPLGIGVSNVPASFKIDSLVLTIDNQEQQILKLGGFFEEETIEFTD